MRHGLTNIKMKRFSFFNKIILLYLALAYITSCNTQDIIRMEEGKTNESERGQVTLPKIVKPAGMAAHENIFCGLQDRSGKLWFGTTGAGVYSYDGESFINYTTEDGLNSNEVWSIIEDKAGNILFGTSKGISRYDGKSFNDFTQHTVLNLSSIYTMLEDKKGRLWVSDYRTGFFVRGEYESGIYLYNPSVQQTGGAIFIDFLSNESLGDKNDLKLLRTNSIIEDPLGNIWFAGQNKDGLIFYDGKTLVQYKSREEEGIFSNVYRSMVFDKKGNLWLGTHGRGVLRSVPAEDIEVIKSLANRKANFIDITKNTGIGNSVIMSMIEDKNGYLWFCTDGQGVWRYNGKSFKNFNTEDGLLNNSVFSVVEDEEGNLWFGTRDVGLYRYDGKSFVSFSG